MKSFKKILACAVSISVMALAVACTGTVKPNKEAEDYPITSNWDFYSSTHQGNTLVRHWYEDENELPRFVTQDGERFDLTVTGENYYHGLIVLDEDGTYYLVKENDDEAVPLAVVITEDGSSNLVFVAE